MFLFSSLFLLFSLFFLLFYYSLGKCALVFLFFSLFLLFSLFYYYYYFIFISVSLWVECSCFCFLPFSCLGVCLTLSMCLLNIVSVSLVRMYLCMYVYTYIHTYIRTYIRIRCVWHWKCVPWTLWVFLLVKVLLPSYLSFLFSPPSHKRSSSHELSFFCHELSFFCVCLCGIVCQFAHVFWERERVCKERERESACV